MPDYLEESLNLIISNIKDSLSSYEFYVDFSDKFEIQEYKNNILNSYILLIHIVFELSKLVSLDELKNILESSEITDIGIDISNLLDLSRLESIIYILSLVLKSNNDKINLNTLNNLNLLDLDNALFECLKLNTTHYKKEIELVKDKKYFDNNMISLKVNKYHTDYINSHYYNKMGLSKNIDGNVYLQVVDTTLEDLLKGYLELYLKLFVKSEKSFNFYAVTNNNDYDKALIMGNLFIKKNNAILNIAHIIYDLENIMDYDELDEYLLSLSKKYDFFYKGLSNFSKNLSLILTEGAINSFENFDLLNVDLSILKLFPATKSGIINGLYQGFKITDSDSANIYLKLNQDKFSLDKLTKHELNRVINYHRTYMNDNFYLKNGFYMFEDGSIRRKDINDEINDKKRILLLSELYDCISSLKESFSYLKHLDKDKKSYSYRDYKKLDYRTRLAIHVTSEKYFNIAYELRKLLTDKEFSELSIDEEYYTGLVICLLYHNEGIDLSSINPDELDMNKDSLSDDSLIRSKEGIEFKKRLDNPYFSEDYLSNSEIDDVENYHKNYMSKIYVPYGL